MPIAYYHVDPNGVGGLHTVANYQDRFELTAGAGPQLLSRNVALETRTLPFGSHIPLQPAQGFGHIGISVPDVHAACERFERLGIEFVKRPDDGKMKGLAFIKDPDGYWVEILNPKGLRAIVA